MKKRQKPVAILSNRLYVDEKFIEDKYLAPFTYKVKERASSMPRGKAINLIGLRFGRLTVLAKKKKRTKIGLVRWKCICNCLEKNIKIVVTQNLRNGGTRSCGCILNTRNKILPKSIKGARWISLTKGKFALVDKKDFHRLSKISWESLITSNNVYAVSNGLLMHRFILNAPENKDVDHRNRNGLDNRRKNLRLCSVSQNIGNSRKTISPTSSKFKGVSWNKNANKWHAYIMKNYKRIHLGLFKSELKAAKAYDKAAIKTFGKFARCNF